MERKPFEDRLTSLKNARSSYDPIFQDISDYALPTHGFFSGTPGQAKAIDHKKNLNFTPTKAIRIMSSGMTSGLTSPSRPWFKLGLQDHELMEYTPVKLWLDEVQKRMMAVFHRSNIYSAFNHMYTESIFGTAAMIILEDYNTVIRAVPFTVGEYYLGTGPDRKVNAFARVCYFTKQQLVDEFGEENVSTSVKSAFANKSGLDDYVTVNHLIQPNDKRIAGREDSQNMPFISVYWEEGGEADKFLRITGFNEFPVLAPRWFTVGSNVYGIGPGWEALGDCKQLHKMEKQKLIGLNKIVDPPVVVDSGLKGKTNLLPGGVTYAPPSQSPGVRSAYDVTLDLNHLRQTIADTKMDIMSAFYADIFLMISNIDKSGVTVEEIVRKNEEKFLMLGPVIGRLEGEMLDPTIDRTFNIMLRNGMIPPPPQELYGQDLKVEYISVLAQAQKIAGTASIQQFTAYIGSLAEAFPEAKDKLNIDEAIDDMGDMLGVSPKIVRSTDDANEIRQQRQKQLQAQQQAQMAIAAVDAGKKLSDTRLKQGSALDSLMGEDEAAR